MEGTPHGVCPITKEPFVAGDPVYILKSDQVDARNGIPIPCISVPALWARSMSEYALREGGFVDPLFREKDKLRLIQQVAPAVPVLVPVQAQVSQAPHLYILPSDMFPPAMSHMSHPQVSAQVLQIILTLLVFHLCTPHHPAQILLM